MQGERPGLGEVGVKGGPPLEGRGGRDSIVFMVSVLSILVLICSRDKFEKLGVHI